MIPLGNRYFLPFSQNIIIRVNARALIYFWYLKGGRNRALVSFLILIWPGIRKTGKRTYCLWILPGCNDQPSNRRKILRRDLTFEGTVHSWQHDSSETGAINGRWTKIDKRNAICKFNETWSQRNLPNFTRKNEWPAKSPVLNPVQNFRSIIDKDLVPKTIGTWKKNPRRRRESKRNKISNKQNNCETRTFLSRPLQNKRREITNFFLRPFSKETSTENFFPSMFQNGHKLLNTLYNWLTLGYLRLFSCSRGSYS